MQEKIKNLIKNALKKLNIEISNIILEHPSDLKMGDYSTNVALAVAKNIGTNPKELAEKIVEILRQAQGEFTEIQEIQVAGAGFINFYLSRKFFGRSVEEILNTAENFGKNNLLEGKKIMVEYPAPNPFKLFHIGPLIKRFKGLEIGILHHYFLPF